MAKHTQSILRSENGRGDNYVHAGANKQRPYGTLFHKSISLFIQVNKERLTKLAQWVDQNNIKVHVDRTFSIYDTAMALDYVKDVHPRGKVVLTM